MAPRGCALRRSNGIREISGEDCGLRIPSSTMVMTYSWRETTELQTQDCPNLPSVPVPQMQCESYRAARLEGTSLQAGMWARPWGGP